MDNYIIAIKEATIKKYQKQIEEWTISLFEYNHVDYEVWIETVEWKINWRLKRIEELKREVMN